MPGDAHLLGSKVSNASGHDCSVDYSPNLCARDSSMLLGSYETGREETDRLEWTPTNECP